MKLTERLYDNGHIKEFEAKVLECVKVEKGFNLVLDKTAFFPNGGGQLADGGMIDNANVLDVNEENGVIVHLVDKEFNPGDSIFGKIDWETRFRRMQNHTGEHIVCGVAHRLFGCENTGFHMGTFGITADLSVLLNDEQVRQIELEANKAVFANTKVNCFYPSESELKTLNYRSKLELTENVRLVEIEGCDLCACCAPHVLYTGEVGIIKFLEHSSNRGGTRLLLKCGLDALEDLCAKCDSVAAISASLCSPQSDIVSAVEALKQEKAKADYELEAIKRSGIKKYVERLKKSENNVCVFADEADMDGLREIVNAGKTLCGGIFGAFAVDNGGYKYCLGSESVDLRSFAKEFNSALKGRGGGRPEMIQGSLTADKQSIMDFLKAEEQ